MKPFHFLLLIALTVSASARGEAADTVRELELINELNKREMQLELQQLRNDLDKQLVTIDKQNSAILARLEQRDSDMGNYIDAISWVSGLVIGFVGIMFGIGAFLLYRENKDVSTRTQEQMDAWDAQTSNLQSTFDDWFNAAKKEYTRELDQLSRIMRLRVLLDQEHPTAEEIYPELSPLFSNPKLEYLPIFRKVMALDLGADIDRHTQSAIDQIMAYQKAQKSTDKKA